MTSRVHAAREALTAALDADDPEEITRATQRLMDALTLGHEWVPLVQAIGRNARRQRIRATRK